MIPDHFQGRAFLGDAAASAPEFAYGYRDRMDERYEMIRSVIDGRFHYIRNYVPHLPWFRGQTRLYPSTNPLLEVWHRLAYAGTLRSPAALYMAEQKPREQFFDLRQDPDEMNNLASDPRYASVLSRFRNALREWQLEIVDLGFLPESQMWLDFDGPEYETVRRDAQRYPLERILETADSVGGGDAELPQQLASLQDEDPTVRFWAATAILAQASAGEAAKPALHPLLADPSVAVRTVAAQALCALDAGDEALQVLVATLNHEQEYAVLRAANALDHLDERARPVLDDMKRHVAKTAALEGQDFFRDAPFTDWALRVAIGELEGTRLPGVVKLGEN